MGYASRTGTKRNIAALAAAGWGWIVGPLDMGGPILGGMPWGLDNGAWPAFMSSKPWDERAFLTAVDRYGPGADFIVVPDVVGDAKATLALARLWLPRLMRRRDIRGVRLLIAVQDGMTFADIEPFPTHPRIGIFIGGSTEWKVSAILPWCSWAKARGLYCHVGRVPKSTVERFLTRLKNETMIETDTGTGRLVITICNYAKYQDLRDSNGTADGTAVGTAAGQQRDIKEQGNKGTREEEPIGSPSQDAGASDVFGEPAAPAPEKPKREKAPAKVAMTADWQPAPLPPTVQALVDLWPPGRLEREVEQFRDYWIDRREKRPGWDRKGSSRAKPMPTCPPRSPAPAALTAPPSKGSTRMRLRCLLIAPLLLVLCACSKTVSVGRTPPPQANLAQRCPDLPPPPIPLIDPARAQWETDLIALYGDCAARHLGLARSWPTDK